MTRLCLGKGFFAFGPLVREEDVPVAGSFTGRHSGIWGSCSGRAHSGWRFRFRAPSIRKVDFAFCRAAARGFFSRKAWRAASRLDRGRRSGRAASESCGRFRRAAHVFVCRFDLADSCGFRPDGPVLSPAFENMRIVRAIMFFNVPNNVCTWDFAPAGCGSQSQAAYPVRTLPPNPGRRRRARAGSRARRRFDGRHRES